MFFRHFLKFIFFFSLFTWLFYFRILLIHFTRIKRMNGLSFLLGWWSILLIWNTSLFPCIFYIISSLFFFILLILLFYIIMASALISKIWIFWLLKRVFAFWYTWYLTLLFFLKIWFSFRFMSFRLFKGSLFSLGHSGINDFELSSCFIEILSLIIRSLEKHFIKLFFTSLFFIDLHLS